MVRRKIEIKPIEDKAKRHTTFTKRRKGLMKKTEEFCIKSGSAAAVITFSSAGNLYVLAHPDVDTVLAHYEAAPSPSPSSASAAEPGSSGAGEREEEEEEEEEEAAAPLTEVEKRIAEGMKSGDWEEAARGLELQELEELYEEMQNLWRKVDEHETKLREETVETAEEEEGETTEEEDGESGASGEEGSCRSC